MLRRIKYFQAVVRNNSFSEAAEECHISQSAISQQIKALEMDLGFPLLERKNRKFFLTPAGEFFYRRSLVLTADYERMCSEAAGIARGKNETLKIGFLRSYDGPEVRQALEEFSERYPEISVRLLYGNHEELFALLRTGGADLVLNDQRRAFSDEYINLILDTRRMYIDLAARNPAAGAAAVTAGTLRNIPCILVASKKQQENEREFYQTVIGIQSEILYAETPEEARMMVVSGQGYLPEEDSSRAAIFGDSVRRIPFCRGGKQVIRNYCLFCKKENFSGCIEKFANLLESKFKQ